MSADRLREMLSGATPGPWRTGSRVGRTIYKGHGAEDLIGVMDSRADAALAALAPDAIALLADMGEQMEAFEEILTRSRSPVAEIDERMRNLVAPMMARLDALCGDEG